MSISAPSGLKLLDLTALLTGPPPKRDWLVDGLIPFGQTIVMGSHPGVGKSYLALDLGLALVSGQEFLGRKIDPGAEAHPVLYVDEENDLQTIHERLHILAAGRGLGPGDVNGIFHYAHMALCALSHADVAIKLIPTVERLRPSLLVLDTWTSIFPFRDENDNAEAAQAVKALKRIKSAHPYQMTVLILHHLDKTRGDIRGAGFLKGATDATYRLVRTGRELPGGFYQTDLVADKVRAAGADRHIRIRPESGLGGVGVTLQTCAIRPDLVRGEPSA